MRNITVKEVWKSYGGNDVLKGVSFALADGKRLALIGENGSGKSTLLQILSGQLKPDSGQVFGLSNGCAYVAQDFSGNADETPYEFLDRRTPFAYQAVQLLGESGFDLGENDSRPYQVSCGELSGGERKKLEIVAGLASNSSFIALDEPENHLDYQTIEWLVGVLSGFRGGVIFVSHNQYFIDQLADSIIELEDGTTTVYSMSYNDYISERGRQIAAQARDWVVEDKTLRRLHETLQMMHWRAKRNPDTAATYQQTKRRYEEMKANHGQKPSGEPNKPRVKLAREVDQKGGKVIVSVNDLSFAYDDHVIFRNASADLRFGDKVVLFGPNGSGKSTLVKLITGELVPQGGLARVGSNVAWQTMTQDHLEGLDGRRSALDVFRATLHWPEGRCRSHLSRYGLDTSLVLQPLDSLSGGQRARFKLALTFAQEPEFLILDEPTNHVDPPTWEAIVEATQEYKGTALIVTHDREFIDAVAEKLWVLGDGRIRVELGNLSDYIRRRKAD